jgi:chorismate mutase
MKSIDPYTIAIIILTIPPAIHAIEQLVRSVIGWQKMRERDVSFQIEIKNTDEEIKQKINALLEEIRQKRETEKHS